MDAGPQFISPSSVIHAGQNHNIQIGNKSFETVNSLDIWEQPKQIRIPFQKKLRID